MKLLRNHALRIASPELRARALACAGALLLAVIPACSSNDAIDPCRAEWSKHFDGGGDELAASVALTPSGDVVLAGYGYDVDFGGVRQPDVEGSAFVARFDTAGAPLWSVPVATPSWVLWMALASDSDDGAIVYGDFELPVDFGGGVIAPDGSSDGFVLKLDAQGQRVFSRTLGGTGYHHGCGVAVAPDGGIVVAGSFEDELALDQPITSQGRDDVFVAKLDASGAVTWSKSYGDAGEQRCSSLAVDAQGNILLGGTFEGAIDFGGGPLQSEGGAPFEQDLFVAKLDGNGQHRFSHRIGAHGVDGGPLVAAAASGNVIVAGGVGAQVEPFGEVIVGSEDTKLFVLGLDSDGSHLWTDSLVGAGEGALSLAVGPRSIFVAGSVLTVSVTTWSLDGALLGADRFLVPGDEPSFGTADSLAAAADGGVVVAGSFSPALDFGCGGLEAANGLDLFVAHLRPPP